MTNFTNQCLMELCILFISSCRNFSFSFCACLTQWHLHTNFSRCFKWWALLNGFSSYFQPYGLLHDCGNNSCCHVICKEAVEGTADGRGASVKVISRFFYWLDRVSDGYKLVNTFLWEANLHRRGEGNPHSSN